VTPRPDVTLAAARWMLTVPTASTAGMWPRAAAHLTRRALEEGLDELWRARAPGVERASARAQLAVLPEVLRDPDLAAETAYTWSALSAACHHHAYELAPTAAELEAHMAAVDRLLDRIAAVAPA
jgi:hypothetical protein